MKFILPALLYLSFCQLQAQNLQVHYDLRHMADPKTNPKNFPSIFFEYFKVQDSGRAFIKPGAFLFKMQADLAGPGNKVNKMYAQITQTLRCWRPPVFLHLSLSGGLGITEPKQFSYYIVNTYAAGAAFPFQWKGGYYSIVLDYKFVPYKKPSSDWLMTFYFYKAFFNYRLELLGDFSCWTENRNHGEDETLQFQGKQFFLYAEPQLWLKMSNAFSLGTKINIYYHVNEPSNKWQVYPDVGIRWKI